MGERTAKLQDIGLLILRIGIGIMFLYHGVPKLLGGPATWTKVGGAMGMVGINFAPQAWGFMAACAEGIGGALLILGILMRPACAAMAFTMLIATVMLLRTGAGFQTASHAIELGIVFIGLMLTGPGVIRVKPSGSCGCCCSKS
jgi:putative oxidoreductase